MSVQRVALGIVIAFDILIIIALLYLETGPFNPLSFLYLVQVALTAIVLPAVYTWGLVEKERVRARNLASRSEKLASLATLATGAARELSTPLSAIEVAARRLERAMEDAADAAIREDAQLIRREVQRCREILLRMAADAGQSADCDKEPLRVRELLQRVLDGPSLCSRST